MTISLPEETWEDLLRSMQGLAGDFISPGTRKNFEAAYQKAHEAAQWHRCHNCGGDPCACIGAPGRPIAGPHHAVLCNWPKEEL